MKYRSRRTRRRRDTEVVYDEHTVAAARKTEAAGVRAVMVSLQRGLTSTGPLRTVASKAIVIRLEPGQQAPQSQQRQASWAG
ncbi:hypothetical protein [Mycobacterium sp.]|uniref:hypothetical protein n=1 Tax=Mycobacterium sp. TaxID=1785 RepID=UPI003BAF8DBD